VHIWIVVLLRKPFSILEGMLIGAYAIGANQGIVYVRDEYPIAVKTMKNAIIQARQIIYWAKTFSTLVLILIYQLYEVQVLLSVVKKPHSSPPLKEKKVNHDNDHHSLHKKDSGKTYQYQ